jgi:hypothetical protein
MSTQEQFRKLALAMPEATEGAHFGNADFRVKNKIFATLGAGEGRAVLKLPVEEMHALIELDPNTFEGAKGWAKSGWTKIALRNVSVAQLRELMDTAWREVAPKRLAAATPRASGKTAPSPDRSR